MSLTFHPPIPFVISLALGLAVLGAWVYLGRKSKIGWLSFAIRVLAVALALFALAGPSKETSKAHAGSKPKLTIVLDNSASMGERWKQACLTKDLVATAFSKTADVREQDLDGQAFSGRTQPAAPQTDLISALHNARGADVIVLISDGHATTLPAGDWPASLKSDLGGAPVYAAAVGGMKENEVAPLRVDVWADAAVAYPRQAVGFTAQVTGRPGEQVALASGDLWSQTLVIPPCGVASVSFTLPVPISAQGQWATTLTAQGEKEKATAQVALPIVPGPARVLLLEGAPCAHTREIGRALAEDPCCALVAVYDLGPRRLITRSGEPLVAQEIPQAIDGATLSAFDVVVLGARSEAFFPDASAVEALVQFSKRGGILFARGREDRWPAALLAGVHEVAQEESVRLGDSHAAHWRQTVAKLANGGQALAVEERLKKAKTADPQVFAQARELADTRPNLPMLEAICEATGGRIINKDDKDNDGFEALWNELIRLQSTATGDAQVEPAFNRLWLLAAFIGLLAADFFLRRRRGQA